MGAFCTPCGRTCSAGRVPWLCCPWHCWHRTWRVMSPGHPQPEETPTHRPRPQLSAAPHFSNSVTSYNVTLLSFLTRHGDLTPLSLNQPLIETASLHVLLLKVTGPTWDRHTGFGASWQESGRREAAGTSRSQRGASTAQGRAARPSGKKEKGT